METARLYIGVHGTGKKEFYRAALCTKAADGVLASHLDNHVYGCTLNEVLQEAVAKATAPLRVVDTEPVDRDPRSTEDFKSFSYHGYRPLTPLKQQLAQLRLEHYATRAAKRKDNKAEHATVNA